MNSVFEVVAEGVAEGVTEGVAESVNEGCVGKISTSSKFVCV